MTRKNRLELTSKIKEYATKLGFELVGIAPAEPPKMIGRYESWLRKNYHGDMAYLDRHLPLKQNPRTLLENVKSVISLGINYHTIEPNLMLKSDPSRGQISRYAWGDDYHDLVRSRLNSLVKQIVNFANEEFGNRVFVDSGPVLEREYAQNSGIGWIGKNTNLINWQKGSWFFLAEILTELELEFNPIDEVRGGCGSCRKCIVACPTSAIVEPNVVDSRLCISYLTIEHKGSIPRDLRPKIGNLIFGCDICQEVCPWNNKALPTTEKKFRPRRENFFPKLLSLINMSQEEFSRRFKGSPIKRAKRRGFLRNVAVAIGNWKSRSAIPALARAINDREELIRIHVAWALGQIGTDPALEILKARLAIEQNPEVVEELKLATR